MMQWFIILLLIGTIAHTELRYHSLRKQALRNHIQLVVSRSARQSNLKKSELSRPDPDVDFDPKTVRRDTTDLPLTGRMGGMPIESGEENE